MSLPQTNPVSGHARGSSIMAAIVVLAVLGVFIFIYVISRQTPNVVGSAEGAPAEDQWKFSSEGRAGRLAELRAKEAAAATSYGWVDEKAGIVRLPIDRAVELTIRDLNAVKR